MHIKKNDTVIILSGKDKGKQGVVIEVVPKKGKVKVRGIALATHHVKARRQGEVSAIKKEEAYIAISNVAPLARQKSEKQRVADKE